MTVSLLDAENNHHSLNFELYFNSQFTNNQFYFGSLTDLRCDESADGYLTEITTEIIDQSVTTSVPLEDTAAELFSESLVQSTESSASDNAIQPTAKDCQMMTYGGNSGGTACVFPFVYNGIIMDGCMSLSNNSSLWCATTSSYDKDKLWGLCKGNLLHRVVVSWIILPPCLTSSVHFSEKPSCHSITEGTPHLHHDTEKASPSISYTSTASPNVPLQPASPAQLVNNILSTKSDAPNSFKSISSVSISPHSTKEAPKCIMTTTGGNSNGSACVFPFLFRGIMFYECSRFRNKGIAWCATTDNFDKDELWGNCIGKTS